MKKVYNSQPFWLFLITVLLSAGSAFSQTITIVNISVPVNGTVCEGSPISGTFTVAGIPAGYQMTGYTIRHKPGPPSNCDEINNGSNGGNPMNVNITPTSTGGTYSFTYTSAPAGIRRLNIIVTTTASKSKSTALYKNVCTSVFQVNQSATVSNVSSTSVACYGESTGSISFDATAGYPATFTATLSGASSNQLVASTSGTYSFTGLPAGNYTVTVDNGTSCPGPSSQTISIAQPAAALVAASGGKTDPTCDTPFGGSFTITATGGTGAYTYNAVDENSNSYSSPDGVFSGFGFGVYTATVTDANNCVSNTVSVTLTEPTNCTTTPPGSGSISCALVDGKLVLTATGFTGSNCGWYYIRGNQMRAVTNPDAFGNVDGVPNGTTLTLSPKSTSNDGFNPIKNICFVYMCTNGETAKICNLPCASPARIGISAETSALKLSIQSSPNPTNGLIQVTITGAGSQKAIPLKLYDLSQRLGGSWSVPLTNGQGQATIDIHGKADGVYILTAEGEQGKASQRIIKGGN
ncbi:hypothetical protein GCM10023187_12060 [Nibrella viscosa]|uniref:Por secretion system C-terminal sorting domain-containing protein n=1 Tax=Nibrella viscosa TaxID=1084524 RepID=A0ABP8K2M7_9BACT